MHQAFGVDGSMQSTADEDLNFTDEQISSMDSDDLAPRCSAEEWCEQNAKTCLNPPSFASPKIPQILAGLEHGATS